VSSFFPSLWNCLKAHGVPDTIHQLHDVAKPLVSSFPGTRRNNHRPTRNPETTVAIHSILTASGQSSKPPATSAEEPVLLSSLARASPRQIESQTCVPVIGAPSASSCHHPHCHHAIRVGFHHPFTNILRYLTSLHRLRCAGPCLISPRLPDSNRWNRNINQRFETLQVAADCVDGLEPAVLRIPLL
jgi:hypothetical protein